MSAGLAAVTGATGFLGRHLVCALAAEGWRVRVLARRDPVHPLWRELEPEVVIGDLADASALAVLCAGADAVIHVAGLVRARTTAEMNAVNAAGAGAVAAAAQGAAPGARFVLVSSLAARAPHLSAYAASKRAGEAAAAEALGQPFSIARPAVIYGPGDDHTLALFAAAARLPILPHLPHTRLPMIHVQDCARAVAAMASPETPPQTATLCDARADGYAWDELIAAAGRAVGRTPSSVTIPDALLRLAGAACDVAQALGPTPCLRPARCARRCIATGVSLRPSAGRGFHPRATTWIAALRTRSCGPEARESCVNAINL